MRLDGLTEDDARAIALWRYPVPYDCYDYPPWDRMVRERWAVCDDALRREQFLALRPDEQRVPSPAGYVRYRPVPTGLMLHLGLHPDLCGHGHGAAFVGLVLDEARRRAPDGQVALQVRRFNDRARTVYARAGFRLVGDVDGTGPQDLLTMVLGG